MGPLRAVIARRGTYQAVSIEVAEAARVIEDTRCDLNIVLMNHLAIIFQKFGFDTNDVTPRAGNWLNVSQVGFPSYSLAKRKWPMGLPELDVDHCGGQAALCYRSTAEFQPVPFLHVSGVKLFAVVFVTALLGEVGARIEPSSTPP